MEDNILYLYATWHVSTCTVFTVSITLNTPNFGTFCGVAHPREIFNFYILNVYMHILEVLTIKIT